LASKRGGKFDASRGKKFEKEGELTNQRSRGSCQKIKSLISIKDRQIQIVGKKGEGKNRFHGRRVSIFQKIAFCYGRREKGPNLAASGEGEVSAVEAALFTHSGKKKGRMPSFLRGEGGKKGSVSFHRPWAIEKGQFT